MGRLTLLTLFLCLLALDVLAVDRHNFKKCEDAGFCKRNRVLSSYDKLGQAVHGPYLVVPNSMVYKDSKAGISLQIKHGKFTEQKSLVLSLDFMVGDTVRVRVTEENSLHPRFENSEILENSGLLPGEKLDCEESEERVYCSFGISGHSVDIQKHPLRISYQKNRENIVVVNGENLLFFEQYRGKNPKPSQPVENPIDTENVSEKGEDDSELSPESNTPTGETNVNHEEPTNLEYPWDVDGMWEESFRSHFDSKTKGPSAIGVDVEFPGSKHVYGLPEHAAKFALPNTVGKEPYRLYNLDVFKYELDEPMALYGSIPFALAHSKDSTTGIFWNNAAETFVDVFDGSKSQEKSLHFISESGIFDLFVFPGPRPADVLYQYSMITGFPTLPPKFSVGYHQCRWNYKDEADVSNVDKKFDEHNIPYDVLWLDIEHTDGKRYFTWDKAAFPNPTKMINELAAKGRKMVTIVDPHIKRDNGYKVHEVASKRDFYVKNSKGEPFDGWCWPGSSGYLDFLNPEVRKYWAELFKYSEYEGSTPDLFTWNDMNEPSVFNGPEITMQKDNLHFNGWEHRDVHNLYGHYVHRATYEGHLLRSNNQERPFILSRSFFAGSQKYGAVWTGDNMAEWGHLEYSVPMLLSLGISGMPFVGADVGGFFDNPDPELLVRWYQVGAFQPFFRAHAHIETQRREPWLFGEKITNLIRDAIAERYAYLPYTYTAFWISHKTGNPIMKPGWFEFPEDVLSFDIEDQFLLGSAILVKPIIAAGVTSTKVYMFGDQPWYDAKTYQRYSSKATIEISAPEEKIPVLLRGGSVIPKQERRRRSSSQMESDPFTLMVSLDSAGNANGILYIDDGHSFDFQSKSAFLVREFSFSDHTFVSRRCADPIATGSDPSYRAFNAIEKIVVLGYSSKLSSIVLNGELLQYSQEHKHGFSVVTIRKPSLSIDQDFQIEFRK